MADFSSLVSSLIRAENEGNPRHELLLPLGPTPGYLVSHAGYNPLTLSITGAVISKAFFDHGVNLSILQNLPAILDSPKALFKSANPSPNSAVVVLTFEVKGEHPIIVPIAKDRKHGRNATYNAIVSVYGKEGPDPYQKWSNDGLLLWQP